jgi:hypothetical protein
MKFGPFTRLFGRTTKPAGTPSESQSAESRYLAEIETRAVEASSTYLTEALVLDRYSSAALRKNELTPKEHYDRMLAQKIPPEKAREVSGYKP